MDRNVAFPIQFDDSRIILNAIDEGISIIEQVDTEPDERADFQFVFTNPAFEKITKLIDVIGKTMSDVIPGINDSTMQVYETILKTGQPVRFETYEKALEQWFSAYAFPIGEPEQKRIAVIFNDISVIKKSEKTLRDSADFKGYLLKLSDAMRPIEDPVQIQRTACRVLGEHIGASRVLYGDVENKKTVVIRCDYVNGVPPIAATLNASDFCLFTIESYMSGRPVVISDVSTDPRLSKKERNAFQSIHVAANMCLGLVKNGKWVAAFGVHHDKSRNWTPLEISLMEETAERTWAAVERSRAKQALRESEKRQAFLLKLSDALRPLSGPFEILANVTRTAMNYFGADRCYYCEITDENVIIRQDASGGDLPSVVGVLPLSGLPIHRALLKAGQPIIVSDVSTTKTVDEELRQLLIELKIISFLEVPVVKGGNPIGILCITQCSPRNWTDLETELAIEISERTWAAVERVKANEALRESERKYRDLFDSIDEGFCIIEVLFDGNDRPINLRFLEVNEAFGKQTGHLDAEGHCVREIEPDHEQYWFDFYGRIALTGEPARFQEWAQAFGHLYDGYAFRVGKPEQRMVAALFNDITARKQSEAALRESENRAHELIRKLEEADNNKNGFINMLSHELRNPLAAIDAWLQLSEMSGATIDVLNMQSIIRRQVDQLISLTEDLLEISRIMNNKITLHKEIIDVNQVVKEVAKASLVQFEKKDIQLECSLSQVPVHIDADPARISQIVGNLLNNALKYTEQGGKVQLSVCEVRGDAQIVATDNGIGIEAEMLPLIFEPFTQADKNIDRANGGLGLGLSIVKGLTELHGGSVCAKSKGLGKGSSFTIRLPLCKKGEKVMNNQIALNGTQRFRILIIEDNKDLVQAVGTLLTIKGHTVQTASNGLEGLEKVNEFDPDVVLCDIGLPGMDGYEVAKRIRSDRMDKRIYLIALSGYGSIRDMGLAETAGFDRYLIKPIGMQTLCEAIENAG